MNPLDTILASADKTIELRAKRCTKCFITKNAESFRLRIRKNKSGPIEVRLTQCQDCENESRRERLMKPIAEILGDV